MKAKQYTLNDTFTFGKYRGYTIQEIMIKDAEYLEWCKKNIEGFIIVEKTCDTGTIAATQYSTGVEVLTINPWAQRCFKNALRFAEDAKIVVVKKPRGKRACQQLEIAFV